MGYAISAINQVLYFAYDTLDKIFRALGLSWVTVVCFLAVISVILRLFAANLVGTAISVHREHQDSARQQRLERNKAKASTGRGASTSARLSRSDYSFESRNQAARDRFISKTRKG